jgi:hypothetical protein
MKKQKELMYSGKPTKEEIAGVAPNAGERFS